jgi:predicted TIM-barrel fold metal-dependent hydrolase
MTLPRLVAAVLAISLVACRGRDAAPPEPLSPGPIIDMHMHARPAPILVDGKPLGKPCAPGPCEFTPAKAVAAGDPLRLTLEAMDRHNIVLGFLSDGIDDVFTWTDAAPGRFLASPAFEDPATVDLARLEREYAAGRLVGMGEIAVQYMGMPPNDERLDLFYAMAERLDLPLLIHVSGGGGATPGFRIRPGHPELLEDVIVKHPRLRLYFENAGWPYLEEAIALMHHYPQVYADLSTLTWIVPKPTFHRHLEGLLQAGLGKRLMFGSDQMNWPEAIDEAVAAIETAPMLNAAQKRDIFYNNAARFLRLTDADIAKHHGRRTEE